MVWHVKYCLPKVCIEINWENLIMCLQSNEGNIPKNPTMKI